MAHAWWISPSIVGFNMDECEETLLIAAYVATKDDIGKVSWLLDFEKKFFSEDKGVSETYVGRINAALRAASNLRLILRPCPSGWTDYMQLRGEPKIAARRVLLEQQTPSSGEAGRRLAEARTAVSNLPLPSPNDRSEQERLFEVVTPRISGDLRRTMSYQTPEQRPGLTTGEGKMRKHALVVDRLFGRNDPAARTDPAVRQTGGTAVPLNSTALPHAAPEVGPPVTHEARPDVMLDRHEALLSAIRELVKGQREIIAVLGGLNLGLSGLVQAASLQSAPPLPEASEGRDTDGVSAPVRKSPAVTRPQTKKPSPVRAAVELKAATGKRKAGKKKPVSARASSSKGARESGSGAVARSLHAGNVVDIGPKPRRREPAADPAKAARKRELKQPVLKTETTRSNAGRA